MLLRILSDIHVEMLHPSDYQQHFQYVLPPLDTDKDSVLILAGDIWNYYKPTTYIEFIKYIKDLFAHIIVVPGNHEYYNSGFYLQERQNFVEYIKNYNNITLLDDGYHRFVLDGVLFTGATLWTDFNKNDYDTKYVSRTYMNDYNYIRCDDDNLLHPDDLYNIHNEHLEQIKNALMESTEDKTVVITHHGPSLKCMDPKFANSGLANYSFYSELDTFIDTHKPNLWIFGHTHSSVDIQLSDTRVLCNPCGYRARNGIRYENAQFNRTLVIEI